MKVCLITACCLLLKALFIRGILFEDPTWKTKAPSSFRLSLPLLNMLCVPEKGLASDLVEEEFSKFSSRIVPNPKGIPGQLLDQRPPTRQGERLPICAIAGLAISRAAAAMAVSRFMRSGSHC